MQKDFAANVRSVNRASRSLANDLKDFERRAGEDLKRCADEAIRRVAHSMRESRLLFRKLFNLDLEQRDVWWNQTPLPTDPEQRRSFMRLTGQYDLDKGTWAFFEWCASRPDQPDERHAWAMCQLYVDNKLFSPLVEALATEVSQVRASEDGRAVPSGQASQGPKGEDRSDRGHPDLRVPLQRVSRRLRGGRGYHAHSAAYFSHGRSGGLLPP